MWNLKTDMLFSIRWFERKLIVLSVVVGLRSTRVADNSLDRPTSRCRRAEPIVSLQSRDCSFVELRAFSCYRGSKVAFQVTGVISTTWRRELSWFRLYARQRAEGNSRHSDRYVMDYAASHDTIKNWVVPFKRDDFSTCSAPCHGRTKTLTTQKIIEHIKRTNFGTPPDFGSIDRRATTNSRELVWSTSQEDLDLQKFSAMWVPKWLNADQNFNGASRLSKLWNLFVSIQKNSCRDWWPWNEPGYFAMIRRQRNNQWSDLWGHPPPSKFPNT